MSSYLTPVTLPGTIPPAGLADLARDARDAAERLQAGDVSPAAELARRLGAAAPVAGSADWLSTLATLGAVDLSVARVIEPHVDALQILREASLTAAELGGADDDLWGVYAAEGPDMRVDARESAEGWSLSGRKPWCSLAGDVTRALVTAHVGDTRRLFAVSLADATIPSADWASRGLARIPSGPIELADAPATPVGEPGWYLRRPGFWLGGIGVAAIWWGGAVALGRALVEAAARREPDQVAQMLIGRVDRGLWTAGTALSRAADAVAAGEPGATGYRTALRVRRAVAETVEDVSACVARGLGPAPLALDEEHARRVADLQVYVRQDHAERDDAALGRELLGGADGWSWHA